MLPDPLHPAIVHFPIVFVVLLPLVAAGALWAIRRGGAPRRVWAIPALLAAGLTLSAWVAVRTGEAQEEKVEAVVARRPFHTHEEAAERFLALSGVLLLVTAAGFAPGVAGRAARALTVVGALGLAVAGAQVGHTGGQLVYEHRAASAYATPPQATIPAEAGEDDDGGAGH
jgi:uncharacterized membrane protein